MSDTNNKEADNNNKEPKIYAVKRGDGELNFTRRDFLKAAGVVTSATLAGCSTQEEPAKTPTALEPTATPTLEPTATKEPAAYTEEEITEICASAKAHNENVDIMEFSTDGRTFVSAGDGQVKIWSLPNFALLKTIDGIEAPRIAFSPDSSLLLIGAEDSLIRILTAPNWSNENALFDEYSIRDLKFLANGEQVLSINTAGIIKQWDLNNQTLINSVSDHQQHTALFLSPDETMVASMNYTYPIISIWSLPDLELLASIEIESSLIIDLAFSPDGKYLVIPNDEGWISIWSMPDGEFVDMIEANPNNFIWNLEFTADGNQLITTGSLETSIWSFPELEKQFTIEENMVKIIDNGKKLVTYIGNQENKITIWSLDNFSIENTFPVRDIETFWPQVSPTENTLAVAYNDVGIIDIYTIADGQLAMCLMDIASSPPEIEGVEIEVEVEGTVTTQTLPCGSPIPAGAVCTCNCVAGAGAPICSCVGHSTCSCVGHSSCSCVGHTTSPGSHYWYPN